MIVYLLRHQNSERGEWALERGSLLNRIQHPTVIPPPQREEAPDLSLEAELAELDEIDLIGTVQDGSENGNG